MGMNREELLMKGAQVRLQELTGEIRDLVTAFPALPRTVTITVGASTGAQAPKRSHKGKTKTATQLKTQVKREQTMLAKYGTTNPFQIRLQRKAKEASNGTGEANVTQDIVSANSGSQAVGS
jgi:hypothetical protein